MSVAGIQASGGLALEVYRKCRDCQGEYKSLADDVRELRNTLQDIEDAIASRPLDSQQQSELVERVHECGRTLNDLNGLLDKYNGLPAQARRTWDRLAWDEGGADVKANLTTNLSLLSAFYKKLVNDPKVQIQRALEQLADEVSNGRNETSSVASLGTVGDHDDDSGWMQIIRDLGDLGIPENVVTDYRTFIVDWILRAINTGVLTEKIPVEDPIELESQENKIAVPPPIPPKIPSPAPLAPPLQTEYYAPGGVTPPTLGPISGGIVQYESQIPMDEPPSPIEPEVPDTNLIWTAQQIVQHWNKREWPLAKKYLEEQIHAVERGEYVEIADAPAQPDLRILRHLLGVAHSFSGDFLQAKEFFESVVQGIYVQGMYLDDGDIAAARWLGETCILVNQPQNAAFAFSIAFRGLTAKYPLHHPSSHFALRMLEDIRHLNMKTSALTNLKNAFVRSNRDITTILPRMRGTDKFQVISTALESMQRYNDDTYPAHYNSQSIDIAEGFLIQPLVSQTSWPLQQDPMFQTRNTIDLLAILNRPKSPFLKDHIPAVGLGNSKQLTFVTKQPVNWLIEAVRLALNTYAIEWKIQGTMYLLRLSQTHNQIAYYDCFGVKFRKLNLRKVYGIKITEPMYTTRAFPSGRAMIYRVDPGDSNKLDETERKNVVRKELENRLKDFLEQAEKDVLAGKPWPPTEPPLVRAPFEMPVPLSNPVAELPGGQRDVIAELSNEAARKPHEMPNMEIAELPTESYR